MANNEMTPRERMVQATGTVTTYARINAQYVERTLKTADEVTHHLQCIHELIEWAEKLQAAAYDVYGEPR